ncbi:MAG: hypothetical protein K8T26_09955 [Lentisphaerae bacterium]|nr:hypothetical protein [Lentisphaerota bacterium]
MNAILTWIQTRRGLTALCVIAAVLTVRTASAQVQGEIVKAGTGQSIRGAIAWWASTKQYEVSAEGARTVVPLNQVASVRVAPPAAMAAAIQAVRGGQTSGAPVAALEKIVNDYLMLEHDLTAMRWVADAYLKRGDGKAAAPLFDKVMADRTPASLPQETMRAYWDVLLAAERFPELRKELSWAIEQGPRPLAATAQLLRGSMDMQRKQYKDALVEGYLRTIVLFQDVREVQPEALYKATRCFEELGESGNAEKMRKKLLAEYPDSTYSKQVNSGG